ncbi:methyl-accepting chemotaxis protein [Sphingomonas sp.]|uniref:methyl-accepting chemotaxis protein n=1 Tax=Sphingomonas sp. TaxID=28214 RepID=UPI003B00B622
MTAPPISDELMLLRRQGTILLVGMAWVTIALLGLFGMLMPGRDARLVIMIGLIANIGPSYMIWRGRQDTVTRLMVGTLAAIYPALGVSLLAGHPWQMDAHMYFFVALAALTVLCDWRPILLASVLIAAHHLLLELFAPAQVFTGVGNFGRIVFHALAVVLQCALLGFITVKLRNLILRGDRARTEAEAMARDAIAGRGLLEAAMATATAAEARVTQERDRRENAEREGERRRRADMVALAERFEASIADMVGSVGAACCELDDSARSLADLAQRANREAAQTATSVSASTLHAGALAGQVRHLSHSIGQIAGSVDRQATLSGAARSASASVHDAVSALTSRTAAIEGFADTIQEIAGQTNLLALNATIEAARAGEVGRGFAVVAGEVKQLAGQATAATGEIRTLAGSVGAGADIARGSLDAIAAMVEDVARAAEAIREEVSSQRSTAAALEHSAAEAAGGAQMVADDFRGIVRMAGDTERLSVKVSASASALTGVSRGLQAATTRFVEQLQAA